MGKRKKRQNKEEQGEYTTKKQRIKITTTQPTTATLNEIYPKPSLKSKKKYFDDDASNEKSMTMVEKHKSVQVSESSRNPNLITSIKKQEGAYVKRKKNKHCIVQDGTHVKIDKDINVNRHKDKFEETGQETQFVVMVNKKISSKKSTEIKTKGNMEQLVFEIVPKTVAINEDPLKETYNKKDTNIKKRKKNILHDEAQHSNTTKSNNDKKTTKKKKRKTVEVDVVDDEEIDRFCDELDESHNQQYNNWVKLIEANLNKDVKK